MPSLSRHPFLHPTLAGLGTVLLCCALAGPAAARTAPASDAPIGLADLPREALRTHEAIKSGGPFPYAKDGSVFGNRESLLPRKSRGWYREYTVKTPGANRRGARRIVCGGDVPKAPEVCYYTPDHYASFRRIVQ